jgi:hypothetical protein
MTRLLTALLAGLVCATFAHGQDIADDRSIEKPFSRGGIVTLELSSGNYVVRAGATDRLRVLWDFDEHTGSRDDERAGSHEKDVKKFSVDADVSGRVATIRTGDVTNHVRFVIEIPGRSDLRVRMRAGDLRINGIDGDKDVRMTAGDLTIDIIPDSLSLVHASVTFGDLLAHPLGISKDGIRNSLHWRGPGVYAIDVRLMAGDLRLTESTWKSGKVEAVEE